MHAAVRQRKSVMAWPSSQTKPQHRLGRSTDDLSGIARQSAYPLRFCSANLMRTASFGGRFCDALVRFIAEDQHPQTGRCEYRPATVERLMEQREVF
jgi:hypothetical protein